MWFIMDCIGRFLYCVFIDKEITFIKPIVVHCYYVHKIVDNADLRGKTGTIRGERDIFSNSELNSLSFGVAVVKLVTI
jgi:hypothetical protein